MVVHVSEESRNGLLEDLGQEFPFRHRGHVEFGIAASRFSTAIGTPEKSASLAKKHFFFEGGTLDASKVFFFRE